MQNVQFWCGGGVAAPCIIIPRSRQHVHGCDQVVRSFVRPFVRPRMWGTWLRLWVLSFVRFVAVCSFARSLVRASKGRRKPSNLRYEDRSVSRSLLFFGFHQSSNQDAVAEAASLSDDVVANRLARVSGRVTSTDSSRDSVCRHRQSSRRRSCSSSSSNNNNYYNNNSAPVQYGWHRCWEFWVRRPRCCWVVLIDVELRL